MLDWVAYKTNMPLVQSQQMEINYKENSVRAGAYGRGIWKSGLVCPSQSSIAFNNVGLAPNFYEANDITADNTVTTLAGTTIFRATNKITLNPGFTADVTTGGLFQAFIHGCTITTAPGGGTSNYNYYKMNSPDNLPGVLTNKGNKQELEVYPNPTSGLFTLFLGNNIKPEREKEENDEYDEEESNEMYNLTIYNSMGGLVYSKSGISSSTTQLLIDLQAQESGIYLIRMVSDNGEIETTKVIKQ